MNYPSWEVRLPREQATKILARMCERLDACATVSADKPISRFSDSPPGPVTALRMWVVGSYARGASTCGDIDVVLEVDNFRYGAGRLNQLFFRSPQRVSLYEGTPNQNPSGLEFEGAVLVWEAGYDWRSALAGIQLAETAGRYERVTDDIPLRMSQFGGKPWEFESLVSLRKQEVYDWTYVPLETVANILGGDSENPLLERLTAEAERREVGKANRMLLPCVSAYAQMFGIRGNTWTFETNAVVRRGATLFLLGVPPDTAVFDMPGVSEVVVVPHLNRRGPNGFWVLRRGRKHPLAALFHDREAWLITDEQGVPITIEADNREGTFHTVDVLEVHFTEESACATKEGLYEDEEGVFVKRVQGDELLEALGYCDMVDMVDGDSSSVVFTAEGEQRAELAGFEKEDGLVRLSLMSLVERLPVKAP